MNIKESDKKERFRMTLVISTILTLGFVGGGIALGVVAGDWWMGSPFFYVWAILFATAWWLHLALDGE